jgi:uncharacterized protein (TIGR02145 family)
MRKLLLTTAAVAAAIAGAVAAETAFGTFTDERDGQTYRTVKIGKQTWMAQNINYQTKGGSWCYNDSLSYCKKYGRLYSESTLKKACPAGWHVARHGEWNALVIAVGGWDWTRIKEDCDGWGVAGENLKARSGWNDWNDKLDRKYSGNGIDFFGFSALPGGIRIYNSMDAGTFDHIGEHGYWWVYCTGDCDCGVITMSKNNYGMNVGKAWDGGFSVRCVADSP